MVKMDKRVLIGCESSGIVRDAFSAIGCKAWSCDLLPTERPGNHIQGDVLEVMDEDWDLFIVHPSCQYLSSSGLHRNKNNPERTAKTEEAVEFAKKVFAAKSKRVCMENPVGRLGTTIGKASQIIQPYNFGHDASKTTCLWLRGLPLLTPTKFIEPRWVCCGETLPEGVGKYCCPNCNGENKPLQRWANQTDSGQNRLSPSADRWKDRSRTYQGIADAFADQWGPLL